MCVLISREARPSAHIVYYSWFLNAATLGLWDGVFLNIFGLLSFALSLSVEWVVFPRGNLEEGEHPAPVPCAGVAAVASGSRL